MLFSQQRNCSVLDELSANQSARTGVLICCEWRCSITRNRIRCAARGLPMVATTSTLAREKTRGGCGIHWLDQRGLTSATEIPFSSSFLAASPRLRTCCRVRDRDIAAVLSTSALPISRVFFGSGLICAHSAGTARIANRNRPNCNSPSSKAYRRTRLRSFRLACATNSNVPQITDGRTSVMRRSVVTAQPARSMQSRTFSF